MTRNLILRAALAALAFSASACQMLEGLGGGSQWVSLFSGDPAQLEANFKGFRQDTVPAGWRVEDGAIALVSTDSKDLVTREEFEDFELHLEWKISPRGNSGVMFHVSEDPQYSETYFTGPEMQVLDNAAFDGNVNGLHAVGANYALHAAPRDFSRPVGEWNHARIVVQDGRVRQWLNGELCCDYVLGSPEWTALVKASKFGEMPGYGVQGRGKIALQQHGNPVWYRNIRVQRLD